MSEPSLPEYEDNPFIARLPSLMSTKQAMAKLTDLPSYYIAERTYPTHVRLHCV